MLFYLLIKKDGSTILPGPNAVRPDFAPSAAPPHADNTVRQAPPTSLPLPHLPAPSSMTPAVTPETQDPSHPAVATSQMSAPQALGTDSGLASHLAHAAGAQPDLIVQQALQETADKQQRPFLLAEHELDVAVANSSSGVLRPAAAPTHLTVQPQLSLPALPASPTLPPALPPSQSVLVPSAPASFQLQPSPPQLQPGSPQLHPDLPLHQPQLRKQQMLQQLRGMHHQAENPQDISKEFLALLQETSTHLAGSQQPWSGQQGLRLKSAATSGKPEQRQPINPLGETVGVKQKNDCAAHDPSELVQAAAVAPAERIAAEPSVCNQQGQSQAEVSGIAPALFWYPSALLLCKASSCNMCAIQLSCVIVVYTLQLQSVKVISMLTRSASVILMLA